MKKIILTILLLTITFPAFGYVYLYAPRTIQCVGNKCYGMDRAIPVHFVISPFHPNPIPDGTYHFYSAVAGTAEIHYRQDVDPRAPRIEYFSSYACAATFLPNTKWDLVRQGRYWCTTDTPTFCPFYEHNSSQDRKKAQ
jgi:hypothetical protein